MTLIWFHDRLWPASSQASAKYFYKSKGRCSIANLRISIGSDNLDAQFRGVLLHRKPKGKRFHVGELCRAYGIPWCRFATLTVRPGSKRSPNADIGRCCDVVGFRTKLHRSSRLLTRPLEDNRRSLEQPR